MKIKMTIMMQPYVYENGLNPKSVNNQIEITRTDGDKVKKKFSLFVLYFCMYKKHRLLKEVKKI